VLEVATFYTMFNLTPVGKFHVQLCGTTPCMLRGAGDLLDVCRHKIVHEPLEVSADGTLSWEEVECPGACVNAPMIMIGNDTYEDLTAARFEEIVEAFRAGNGASIKPGTQIDRQFSAAIGGRTTLLEEPTAERTYMPFPPPPPPPAAPAGAPAPAPAAPAPKPAEPAAAKPADPPPAAAPSDPKPSKPGRKRGDVPAEAAPGMRDPEGAPKASVEEAESERLKADTAAGANGKPNRAMRESATGAESPAGKIDAGRAPRKPRKKTPPPEGAA
jgi:NADH-quinone oxidoreductase subunit E